MVVLTPKWVLESAMAVLTIKSGTGKHNGWANSEIGYWEV